MCSSETTPEVILVFPPKWDTRQPYLSLPTLTAYLRKHGVVTEQYDLNVEAHDELLSKQELILAHNLITKRHEELYHKSILSSAERVEFADLERTKIIAPHIIDCIHKAKEIIRNRQLFTDPSRYNWSYAVLSHAYRILSAAFYPTRLSFHEFEMRYHFDNLNEVLEATLDEKENPFLRYYSDIVLPSLLADQPLILGLSIVSPGQIIPGLTLARQVKSVCPEVHITIGGAIFSRLVDQLRNSHELFELVDSFVIGEGEVSLLSLVKQLRSGGDLRNVPSLVYLDKSVVCCNQMEIVHDLNTLPPPDYNGLPLEKYLSPELVVEVCSSRGCYWNRCTFCDSSMYGGFRRRSSSLVYRDIVYLTAKHKTSFFALWDQAAPPALLKDLSEKLVAEGHDYDWICQIRSEQSFDTILCKRMAKAGCRQVFFGLESSNKRIRKLMNKGNSVPVAKQVLENFHAVGIATCVSFIVGFPTETHEEARETIDFVLENAGSISQARVGVFRLCRNSAVDLDPNSFSVVKHFNSESDLALECNYSTSIGLSPSEAHVLKEEFSNLLTKNGFNENRYGPDYLIYQRIHDSETTEILIPREQCGTLGFDIMNSKPEVPECVEISPATFACKSGAVLGGCYLVFGPDYCNFLEIDERGKLLLSLCDGQTTIHKILGDYVIHYPGLPNALDFALLLRSFLDSKVLRLPINPTPLQRSTSWI